jgi:L-ascorbate metabolism protein UlaG (beta-lactamase superfamily)
MRLSRVPLALVTLLCTSSVAQATPTKITWLGHAAFEITTPAGRVLLVDPWLKNPTNPSKAPIADIKKADYILVSHGHFDHVGDSVELAKATGARLVTSFELGQNLVRLHGFPGNQLGFDTLGNAGGELVLGDGEITVQFTPAVHSSGLDAPGAAEKGVPIAYGGNPLGFLIKIKGGPTLYHTGDTAYFKDMEVIGDSGPVDLALINIGGHFGMEPAAAVKAAQAVRARHVVAHHYKSFPVLTQDPRAFYEMLDHAKVKHVDLVPGGSVTFEGHELKR